jgi:hypothetical protein
MSRRRVGVLMGGWSAEREVSLRTGDGVAAALESRGHDVVRVVWSDDGVGLDERLRDADVDVVFLALHGRGGEDGCVQGLLELMGLPYTGSGVLASALAMDKLKAKEMFRLHNVPTPPYYVATAGDLDDLEEIHASFGFPVIVKPRREGSSVGMTKATNVPELAAAIEVALSFDDHALVERFVKATEVHVGILDGRVLGAIEVVPRDGRDDRVRVPAAASVDEVARRDEPGRARGAGAVLHRRLPRRSARDRGRERVRPGGQHAAGNDAHVLAAEDRGGRRARVSGAVRGDPRRRAIARGDRRPRRSRRVPAPSASAFARVRDGRGRRVRPPEAPRQLICGDWAPPRLR